MLQSRKLFNTYARRRTQYELSRAKVNFPVVTFSSYISSVLLLIASPVFQLRPCPRQENTRARGGVCSFAAFIFDCSKAPSRRFRCCSSFHLLTVENFDGNIDSVFLLHDFDLIVAQFPIYPV